jgi:alpha-amylase/alpha-mannosidase (GH57 family)
MWLPETACNTAVIDLLMDEGMRFVILAPQQAGRIRVSGKNNGGPNTIEWRDASNGNVDTTFPYRCFHSDGSGRFIAVFFYNAQLAQAIAFEQGLASSSILADRIAALSAPDTRLISVATDGESYGHHHKFGDLCLAYLMEVEAAKRNFEVTNYSEYLEGHSPEIEVEISNGPQQEGTSWSCVHGVSRWLRDCACHTGGEPGWNQAWRAPLRQAINFLRDQAAAEFEGTRGVLFLDPWRARDESIELVLDQAASREFFVYRHAPRELSRAQQFAALRFLELQRHTLLMQTSCGWFFNDISGIEPAQILKYACRAIELFHELNLPSPRSRFLEILAEAKSNVARFGNGADIYRAIETRYGQLYTAYS